MYEVHEDQFDEWAREHDMQYIWKCPTPGCGFEYESRPGINEASQCPYCGATCREAGETYYC